MNILLFALFFVLLLIGVPIWLAMAIPSIVILLGSHIPLTLVIQRVVVGIDSFVLLAVPLFMLAGKLMNQGGITRKIIDFSTSLFGHVPGGLAQVNIVASMFFAGISGSAVADASGLGTILIPSMIKKKYPADFSVAVTAASSMCGPIIPPSIPLVIAGSLGGVSVGKLFLGGAVPGITLGLSMMIVTYIIARRKKYVKETRATLQTVFRTFAQSILSMLMPLIVLGGILAGVVTPTEAAVLAVLYAIIIGYFIYKELGMKKFGEVLIEVGKEVSATLFLIALASLFSYVLTLRQIPQHFSAAIATISTNPLVVLVLLNLALLFLGCFISTTPALILVLPVIMPIAKDLGLDPVHFLVVVVLNLCIAMLTPPVGIVLFITSRIGNVSIGAAVRKLLPYFAVLLGVLALAIVFPQFVTWLPNMFIR